MSLLLMHDGKTLGLAGKLSVRGKDESGMLVFMVIRSIVNQCRNDNDSQLKVNTPAPFS